MYLKEVLIENVGPIQKLDLSLPFSDDGKPRPLILVGANGAGKTVLESIIADALILMATPHWKDITPMDGHGNAYFRLCGGVNQKIGSKFGRSLLAFQDGDKIASYVDLSGDLPGDAISEEIKNRFPHINCPAQGNHKEINGFEEKQIREIFMRGAICFFPSSRREIPHWLNPGSIGESVEAEPELGDTDNIYNILNKPLYVERCSSRNKRWILDVLLDSKVTVNQSGDKLQVPDFELKDLNARIAFSLACDNINKIASNVLREEGLRIYANVRRRGPRLIVIKEDGVVRLPSLNHMSLGQTILFNMFCTLIRYADVQDLRKGILLNEIEGIVIIDEVDAHLHADLQFDVLPELIALFPKVQFIVSTHAPLVLMGLERKFGEDGIAIYELPAGDRISTERFSEFRKSFDYYKNTKSFEDSIKAQLQTSGKPNLIFEGETDKDYVIAYIKLLNKPQLTNLLEIQWVGQNQSGSAYGGGCGSLDNAIRVFRGNLGLLSRKIMLVYDCDVKRGDEVIGDKIYVRVLKQNPLNTKFRRGIENLLVEAVARPEFYDTRLDEKYGGRIEVLNKRRLCDWVIAQNDISLFAGFGVFVAMFEEILRS